MSRLIKDEETLVIFGGPVKALGNGKVGGYLVRFTTDEDPDLEEEFFNADTDVGDAETGTVYYQHGLDKKLRKRRLTKAVHKKDEFGVWAEAQLALRDEYEEFIYQMAEAGKMGWSSGTASHLVEREQMGKATWIKTWPLGLDDSLTPTPAEPRNTAIPLKSWKLIAIPELENIKSKFNGMTLADKTNYLCSEFEQLLSDLRGLKDRPLNEVKRKELTELLEMFSGMDDVRSELQSVLTAPAKLVSSKITSYELAEARKRLAYILKE